MIVLLRRGMGMMRGRNVQKEHSRNAQSNCSNALGLCEKVWIQVESAMDACVVHGTFVFLGL